MTWTLLRLPSFIRVVCFDLGFWGDVSEYELVNLSHQLGGPSCAPAIPGGSFDLSNVARDTTLYKHRVNVLCRSARLGDIMPFRWLMVSARTGFISFGIMGGVKLLMDISSQITRIQRWLTYAIIAPSSSKTTIRCPED
jgi:hypothetical protein